MLAMQTHRQPALQRVLTIPISLRRVIRIRDDQLALDHCLLHRLVLQDRQ